MSFLKYTISVVIFSVKFISFRIYKVYVREMGDNYIFWIMLYYIFVMEIDDLFFEV